MPYSNRQILGIVAAITGISIIKNLHLARLAYYNRELLVSKVITTSTKFETIASACSTSLFNNTVAMFNEGAKLTADVLGAGYSYLPSREQFLSVSKEVGIKAQAQAQAHGTFFFNNATTLFNEACKEAANMFLGYKYLPSKTQILESAKGFGHNCLIPLLQRVSTALTNASTSLGQTVTSSKDLDTQRNVGALMVVTAIVFSAVALTAIYKYCNKRDHEAERNIRAVYFEAKAAQAVIDRQVERDSALASSLNRQWNMAG